MGFDFDPDSIALVGASSDPTRIAGLPIQYLDKHGYSGTIYPINPKHDEISGYTCYPSVEEVPESPDAAMVLLPSEIILDIVEDCLSTGIKNIIVVSSGFSETGTETGAQREAELAALAEEYDAAILGPNSQGIINFSKGVAACFTPALDRDELHTGPVSFVTQSGAFGGALTTLMQEAGIGLDKWVSTGNESALGALSLIDQLAHDNSTEIVAGYLEGFDDGRKLVEIKRTEEGIDLPIVAMKVGTSERGRSAASSHTGTIASEAKVYDSILREHGIITVNDIDVLIATAELLVEANPLPHGELGVLSTSGGAGVYIADRAADLGLELADLSTQTRESIDEHLPDYGSAMNPVDTTAAVLNSTQAFEDCLIALYEDDSVDTILLQITNISGDRGGDLAETFCRIDSQYDKPAVVCWTGALDDSAGAKHYQDAGIPLFENPDRCLKSISAIKPFVRSKSALQSSTDYPARVELPELNPNAPRKLTEVDAKELFSGHGIDTPDEKQVASVEQAVSAAKDLRFPVVVKVVSKEIDHKDRIGGVRLNLSDVDEVRDAASELLALEKDINGTVELTVQEQVSYEHELGLGITIDDDFGPVLLLGRGGVDIESVEDVTFRTIPVSDAQAETMLDDLETVPTESFTPSQKEAVINAIVGLSELFLENRWITECDVNPLVVTSDGAIAVDGLLTGYNPVE
jgi:acyl-CoA synthetase (NDP forming)